MSYEPPLIGPPPRPEPYWSEAGHKRFQERLESSKPTVEWMAQLIRDAGYEVYVPPTQVAPTYTERRQYKDSGDIHVTAHYTIEARQLMRYEFTCAEDWPGQYFIVDNCTTFNAKNPPPYAYYYASKSRRCIATVEVRSTQPHWERIWQENHNGEAKYCYVIPKSKIKDLVEFWKIGERGNGG